MVLSGGAALGAFQAGVIESLAGAGLEPSLLVGTSIGALNAAYWAFNPGRDVGTRLSGNWRAAPSAHIFPKWPTSIVLRMVEDHPIARPVHLLGFLRSIFGEDRAIETAPIPLAIVAVDIVTGEPIVLRKGPLIPALMASAAIPGLYPPVEIEGRLLADGGVVANADLEAVADAGIEDAILIDLMSPASKTQLIGARAMMEQAITIALARQTQMEMRLLHERIRLAVIRLRLPYQPQPWDFSSVEELLSVGRGAGEELVRSCLAEARVRPGVIEPSVHDRKAAKSSPSGAGAQQDTPSVWSFGRRGRR